MDAELLGELRSEWDWVAPAALTTIGLTMIGDWVLCDAEGAVYVLETVEASLDRVATSWSEFVDLVASVEARDRLLLEGLALAALAGADLPRNHCVGYKTPPVLGGAVGTSNLEIVPVARYERWTARLLKAVSAVPGGRQVTGVKVDETGEVVVTWR